MYKRVGVACKKKKGIHLLQIIFLFDPNLFFTLLNKEGFRGTWGSRSMYCMYIHVHKFKETS